jgi:hypothetical protein
MKKQLLLALFALQLSVQAQQPIISKWLVNTTGKLASYWQNTSTSPTPNYVFNTTTDSADVQRVCYSTDSVYVKATGMTDNMGKYLNPGACSTQTYVYCFPRNPNVPTTKTATPANFAVGALINGIPIFGRAGGESWSGTTNTFGGPQVWNTEVYLNEGVSLDTAFGAHPQQQGQYHTHAKPYRLYEHTAANVHSPIIGFAFDGYPVYGPYGYSAATNASSAVTRMKSGYSLRNITTRTTLPDGTTASQTGPAVSTTYPIGAYCEDYAWSASNGGDLDTYNGRFCVTPEYPSGTYAYFTTLTSSGTPQYPYYIGDQYYGTPNAGNFSGGCLTRVMPSNGITCGTGSTTNIFEPNTTQNFAVFPNPNAGQFTIKLNNNFTRQQSIAKVYNALGELVYKTYLTSTTSKINMNSMQAGFYFVHLINENGQIEGVQKIVIE